jgi:predicted O-methyltransferase YrrM
MGRSGLNKMVFATVCIGEDRRSELMHLLNDIRNLECKIFVLTNIDLHLDHFQFFNVIEKKINTIQWNDFQRFEIIKFALSQIEEDEYVYYLDSDSRFIDCRIEKFDLLKFKKRLSAENFDIMCPLFLAQVKEQLVKPDENENKNIRGFTFGYEAVIEYFKKINNNYDSDVFNKAPLETLLIFKRSEKMIKYINELINFSRILIDEELKNARSIPAPACGFAMAMLKNIFEINIIESPLVYHFFKGNFLREVFPFNFKINTKERIFEMQHFYQKLGENWFSYPSLYAKMVEYFPSGSHFVEVGTWKGMSACFMAVEIINSNKDIKFDCVDNWEYVENLQYDLPKELYKDLYETFLNNIKPVKHIINPVRSLSWEGAANYANNSLDFVFIDAAHDYESSKKDIEAWFPKMKTNGIIAGHDYHNNGVCKAKQAVDDFFEKTNKKVEQFLDCWMVYI